MKRDDELDYRRVFEQSAGPCAIVAADPPRFTVLGANLAFLRDVGAERAAVIGRGVFEVLTSGIADLRASLDRVVATGAADTVCSPVSEDGAVRCVVVRVGNLAGSRAAIVSMSHGLRSPLTSILGFADLLAAGADPLTATQREYVEYVRESGRVLQQALDDLLGAPRAAPPPVPPPAPAPCGHLLLVEDDPLARRLTAVLLREEGHDVVEVGSLAEAQTALAARWPDLIATDIGYDGGGGHALLAAVRRDPRGATTPVIAVTGMASTAERDQLYAAGFDGHVVKPIDVDTLLGVIGRLIARRPPAE